MFLGKYDNVIDSKNRMIVPAKFRDELDTRCVLTRGIDKCMYIYTIESWEEFAQKLMALPKADIKARNFVRHFFSCAEKCDIDKQGRVTIPQPLRIYAEFDKDLITVGNGDKVEVWSKEKWDAMMAEVELTAEDIAEGMENYGI